MAEERHINYLRLPYYIMPNTNTLNYKNMKQGENTWEESTLKYRRQDTD